MSLPDHAADPPPDPESPGEEERTMFDAGGEDVDSSAGEGASAAEPPKEPAGDPRVARVVPGDQVRIEPLYPAVRVMKTSLVEADRLKEEASRLLASAKEQAEKLVADAERQAEARRRAVEAELDALRDRAASEAREEATRELKRLLDSFESACHESYRRFPEWVRDSAFRIARHVVDVEFQARPELVREFVERALSRARVKATRIHLHPDDCAVVEPLLDELKEKFGLADSFRVVESEDVERHSVRVETGTNRAGYHLSVDEMFEELKKQIERKVGH